MVLHQCELAGEEILSKSTSVGLGPFEVAQQDQDAPTIHMRREIISIISEMDIEFSRYDHWFTYMQGCDWLQSPLTIVFLGIRDKV